MSLTSFSVRRYDKCMFNFEVLAKDNQTHARAGIIHTAHGEISTPAFVPVGTQATVKSLSSQDLNDIGVQLFFVNTYHMYLRPGLEVINTFGGLHQFMNWDRPLMTDSAGFQIFSLGDVNRKRRMNVGCEDFEVPLVKIGEEGVLFRSHLDGSEHFFTPEKSIEAQVVLGADMMIAFDECTYYPATHDYAQKAMERTHRWAVRSLDTYKQKARNYQALYGSIQGGIYQDLREQSAKFISSLDFPGIAIGGVSVGESKEQMRNVLKWTSPYLPEEKPRHLLGVGEIDDIFALVEHGIDTFDCVMPTRLARMGHILVKSSKIKVKSYKEKFLIDINKAEFAKDKSPLDSSCGCAVCQNYSKAYVHHLFRARELLAYRLATFHNLCFMESLVSEIRRSIGENKFLQLKKEWLL